ncbi:RNA polymerase sigma factor [Ruminococcus sp.]|uniref:RNA polymerase sigma factor n=1 Tax=Ruminococcus sp. TaxID=41978 RepID=UPI0038697F99
MGKNDSNLYAGLSYEQTVRKYAQNVSSACMMRLQNWADAEDCFQNTFIKLYQKSPDFKDESHLKAWLLRVAINECKNLLRDSRRHLSLDAALQLPAPSAEDDADLSWALMKLDPDYREVIYLHYVEQMKVREIADVLGKNPNTVKTLLHRGREKLKAIYSGGDGR